MPPSASKRDSVVRPRSICKSARTTPSADFSGVRSTPRKMAGSGQLDPCLQPVPRPCVRAACWQLPQSWQCRASLSPGVSAANDLSGAYGAFALCIDVDEVTGRAGRSRSAACGDGGQAGASWSKSASGISVPSWATRTPAVDSETSIGLPLNFPCSGFTPGMGTQP